jgi:hypothetical protein
MESQAGASFWLILLTIGVVILGLAMVYGIMRNRKRTLGEQIQTEIETKREYVAEDKDAS